MEKEIEELKEENKEKDNAIFELGKFYDVRIILFKNFFIIYYYKNKDQKDSKKNDENKWNYIRWFIKYFL